MPSRREKKEKTTQPKGHRSSFKKIPLTSKSQQGPHQTMPSSIRSQNDLNYAFRVRGIWVFAVQEKERKTTNAESGCVHYGMVHEKLYPTTLSKG
eukprot:1155906-Pelagomonas_calceolata.AAC.2